MAGCYDRSWRVGSQARGTRSQFRLSTEGLMPFKCTYPAHLTDVMDAVPSTQSDLRRADLVSPVRGTRTRAVREYEQTIEELRKENFDLKLRLFLLEEAIKNKGFGADGQENSVQVIVELKVETEALRNELLGKNQLLQEALDQTQKYASDLKELQDKFEQQQEQLSALGHLPSEQEFRLLRDENESLQKSNEFFTKVLTEKDQDIETLKEHTEELLSKNKALEAKVKKSSLAIQGIVYKYYKDVEMIPKNLRPVVQSAVQAAKDSKEADLNTAIDQLKASLHNLMSRDRKASSESKENNAQGMDSMEELQKAGVSKSMEELTQNLGQSHSKSKFGHDGKDLDQVYDILKENENLKLDSSEKSKVITNLNTTCKELEQKIVELQSELLDAVSKIKNLEFKIIEEKSKHISSLPKKTSSVQTAVQWHLMQSKLSDKLLQNAGQSNNIDVLKEEILTLILVVEQKDKEINVIERKLASLQSQLDSENKKELTFVNLDEDFIKERKELQQRLAHSCAINHELMQHLKTLEDFMEDLLHHRNLDSSSIENISGASSFLSQVKMQIEQSLELTNVLNDQLSICEGSKIFDPSEFSINKEDQSLSDRQSYQPAGTSRLSLNASNVQGRNNSLLPFRETLKNAAGTGKRRLSFSTLHSSSLDTTLRDSENVVVLGTSNNEDLILLLNEKGDPEDVLIRNNHSHLDKNASPFSNEEQHHENASSGINYFNQEKSFADHHMERWCNSWNSELANPKMISGWLNPYPSSDSDIWSEPDRDVSLQRIGIDLQKSPVSQKSPRRSRFRDKLSTDDISSQKNESSSSFTKLHTWSKRRKSSDTSKSSFICKKCMSHYQPSEIPSKEEKTDIEDYRKAINDLSRKCSSQENHLVEVLDELKSKKNIIEALSKEKQELLNSMNCLKDSAKVRAVKSAQTSGVFSDLSIDNDKFQARIKELESKITHADAVCNKLKGELGSTKDQLKRLEAKCSDYENDLNMLSNAKNEYAKKLESVENEKSELLNEIDVLIQEKKELSSKLESVENEKSKLLNEIDVLIQEKKEFLSKLEPVENEKSKLLNEIEVLIREKKELLSKIESETVNELNLKDENYKLRSKVEEKSREISSLRTSNEEFDQLRERLLKEREAVEIDLQSSNSLCDKLKKDLRETQVRLENLESKCVAYEKELNESSKFKQNIIKSLFDVNCVMSTNLDALTYVCQRYLNGGVKKPIDIEGRLSETDKKDEIGHLFDSIILANTNFEKTIKSLSEQLISVHAFVEKNKRADEEYKSKVAYFQRQLLEKDSEIQSLKMLNSQFKKHIDELQLKLEESKHADIEGQSKLETLQHELDATAKEREREHRVQIHSLSEALNNKDKSLENLNIKISDLQKQLNTAQSNSDKNENKLNAKDDEITKLQERIFNMQTHINSLLAHRTSSPAGQMASKDSFKENAANSSRESALSNGSDFFIPSDIHAESASGNGTDVSFSSVTSEKDNDMNKRIERYSRKIKALQTKLSMTEKRIEILEKEKSDLREQLLTQVQEHVSPAKSSEDVSKLLKEIEDLKAAMEKKTSFIKELKSELFKTCNSVVDKQKEIVDLQRKLSENKVNAEATSSDFSHKDIRFSYSDPIHKSMEANIRELQKHKWELIQGILKQQKQFYERKNIHLGHFKKFKNHIEELRSLHVSPSLFKSESEPTLNTPMISSSFYAQKCDITLKNLQIELELDVECLQNLKIFLKRFFIPLVIQNCSCNATNAKTDNDSNNGAKQLIPTTPVTDVKDLQKEHLKLDLWGLSSRTEVANSSDRLITTASVVAHNLELVETSLKKVKTVLEHFKETDSATEGTPKKIAAKSLLLKILNELINMQENSNEMFHLNSVLKSLGLFDINIPQSPSKQDMSDRESLLSEETIALSRSGSLSPMSFENFPSKLFTNETKHKQESDEYGKNETENKQSLSSQKLQTSGGSQDSIFLRSHFSSPDLGIESDPNHESSAPEQTEKDLRKGSLRLSKSGTKVKQWTVEKQLPESTYGFIDSSSRIKVLDSSSGTGNTLHAIGYLKEYELLKKEVQESLISVKAVLSRTGDGLLHVSKYTSPRKNLEYSTFKAIKDACGNIEICLQKATKLVDNFWVAPCPSVKELNVLIEQNQEQQEKLKLLQNSKQKQESYFKEVMDKLKQAEQLRENMEKKISKKLVKTKKVIRQAEIKILEKGNQDLPSIPKYPSDESACQKHS